MPISAYVISLKFLRNDLLKGLTKETQSLLTNYKLPKIYIQFSKFRSTDTSGQEIILIIDSIHEATSSKWQQNSSFKNTFLEIKRNVGRKGCG